MADFNGILFNLSNKIKRIYGPKYRHMESMNESIYSIFKLADFVKDYIQDKIVTTSKELLNQIVSILEKSFELFGDQALELVRLSFRIVDFILEKKETISFFRINTIDRKKTTFQPFSKDSPPTIFENNNNKKSINIDTVIAKAPKQPTPKQPTTKQTTTKQPITQQPTPKLPITKQPTTKQTTTKQPITKQPTTKQTTTKQPITKQPTTKQPITKQPTPKQPIIKQPTTKQPTTKQTTTKQLTTKHSTFQPFRKILLTQIITTIKSNTN